MKTKAKTKSTAKKATNACAQSDDGSDKGIGAIAGPSLSPSSPISASVHHPLAKPKLTKAGAQLPSPSPPPLVIPPPLQTIQLEIQIGRPDNYEVDMAAWRTVHGFGQVFASPQTDAWVVWADKSRLPCDVQLSHIPVRFSLFIPPDSLAHCLTPVYPPTAGQNLLSYSYLRCSTNHLGLSHPRTLWSWRNASSHEGFLSFMGRLHHLCSFRFL